MTLKPLLAAAALVLIALLPGCGTASLHPLATPETTVADDGVLGAWVNDEEGDPAAAGKNTYNITKGDTPETQGAYLIEAVTRKDDGNLETAHYEARLVKLDKTTFIQLFPSEEDRKEIAGKHGSVFQAAYVSFKFERDGDKAAFTVLDGDWLDGTLKADPKAVKHERLQGDQIVLTADTAELQKFYAKAAGDAGAFKDPAKVKRKVAAKPAK